MSTEQPTGKRRRSRRKNKTLLAALALPGVALLIGAWLVFGRTGARHPDYFFVRTGWTYAQTAQALRQQGFISGAQPFDFVATRMDVPARLKPGKYRIPRGSSNFYIARLLRSGRQEPVKLLIKKTRTQQEFIRQMSAQVEADSAAWVAALRDATWLNATGADTASTLLGMMPNTYEVYWTWKPARILQKVADYHKQWWTPARLAAAEKLCGSKAKAITLASIVDEESNKRPDRDTIASVYLNRLAQGMKLQADPTARYAWGDFTIKRITSVQTNLQSPYNTYYAAGLPPGPICTPGESSLKATLDAPSTGYLYFCAKPDGSGTHAFAKTYDDHLKNARAYQAHLDAKGVR